MAKLHNYHILCPLIDQKSFLGVAQDKEEEHVIITLGRNVVNKHRLSDQKQVSGWTSKDHITAPVIYDKEQNSYVGVFNKNTIKTWTDEDANLDKLKKFKFPINILKLIPRIDQPSLIIFTNGNCASLPYAIENRKTYESKSLLKDTDEIIEIAWYKTQNTDHICYILKTTDGYEVAHCPLRDELGDLVRSKLTRVKITRNEDIKVAGQFISGGTTEKCYVYILWSDAKMSGYDLNLGKWKNMGTIPWMSTASSVSMTLMAKNHLIIFGSNKDQDGAIIIAYNYILHVASCKYPMKMYRENSKLFCYDGRIILEASNHIGMLPFTVEENRNLSSLLGSHEVIQNDSPSIADWGTPTDPIFQYIPELEESIKIGITEGSACANVMPMLIERNDTNALINVLRECKDIPESSLAALVSYAVKSHVPNNNDEDNVDCELLNEIFRVLFCDALLIPHLRNNLSVTDSLNLLKYILYLIFKSDLPLDVDYESRLYDWCMLIFDAFYQQYVMSKDPKVGDCLKIMSEYVNTLIDGLQHINNNIAELHKLTTGTSKASNENNQPYTIEIMQI